VSGSVLIWHNKPPKSNADQADDKLCKKGGRDSISLSFLLVVWIIHNFVLLSIFFWSKWGLFRRSAKCCNNKIYFTVDKMSFMFLVLTVPLTVISVPLSFKEGCNSYVRLMVLATSITSVLSALHLKVEDAIIMMKERHLANFLVRKIHRDEKK